MILILLFLSLLVIYLLLNNLVTRRINTIFRHDLFNDLQLVDGYITLNKLDKSKQYLNSAYDKKDIYSILDKCNIITKISYLLLYNKLHKRTSNFNIYISENIFRNMFFSLSFVKTIFKVFKYIKNRDISTITIEVEKDCIEVITSDSIKSYLL